MWGRLQIPYRRLSAFYFFYFAVLGAWIPYWGLFLQDEGHSPAVIGFLSAIVMVTKVVAPSVWGWLGDRTGRRMAIVRLGSLLALLLFLGIFVSRDVLALVVIVASYSFFWNAVLPQFEVVTLNWLREHARFYSLVRLWGSVGFILAVGLLGLWFDHYSLQTLPLVLSILLLGIWLSSLSLPSVHEGPSPRGQQTLWRVLRRPEVIGFFAASLLLQFSHGPYYTFFSIYLEGEGFSRTTIGALWALGVLAEVLLFTRMHDILHRWSIRDIMVATLLLSALRWLLVAEFAHNIAWLIFAQLLHAASFGSAHAVAVEFVRRYFGGGHQGQGQALYSGLSFGAGGALGALASGLVWEQSAALTFHGAALVCVLATALAWASLRGDALTQTAPQADC